MGGTRESSMGEFGAHADTGVRLLLRRVWGQWYRFTRLLENSRLLHQWLGTRKTMWDTKGHLGDSPCSFHERWEELDQGPEF